MRSDPPARVTAVSIARTALRNWTFPVGAYGFVTSTKASGGSAGGGPELDPPPESSASCSGVRICAWKSCGVAWATASPSLVITNAGLSRICRTRRTPWPSGV